MNPKPEMLCPEGHVIIKEEITVFEPFKDLPNRIYYDCYTCDKYYEPDQCTAREVDGEHS